MKKAKHISQAKYFRRIVDRFTAGVNGTINKLCNGKPFLLFGVQHTCQFAGLTLVRIQDSGNMQHLLTYDQLVELYQESTSRKKVPVGSSSRQAVKTFKNPDF